MMTENDPSFERSPEPLSDTIVGGGAMGALIRSLDWSKNPLGPYDSWPQSLRTSVSLCLSSTFPISIVWGPEFVQIYNDSYRPICGAQHPQSMGQRFWDCWESARPAVGAIFERALAGEGSYIENQCMYLERYGYLEEAFMTFSFSPIRNEAGEVGGLFHPITETTERMLGARRTQLLRDLAGRLSAATTTADVYTAIATDFTAGIRDLPFLLFFETQPLSMEAELKLCLGITDGAPPVGLRLALTSADASPWPLAQAMNTVDDPYSFSIKDLGPAFAAGPYPEPPHTAMVVPLRLPGLEQPAGFLVAGVSPRRALDVAYHDFYVSLGRTIATAMLTVRAYEQEAERARALAEIDQAKTAFFSNVSHEFRTPLTLMLGPLESLAAGGDELPAAMRGEIAVVQRNSQRLMRLVNTLLDFSRIEAGRIQATYRATDLSTMTLDLASGFRSAMEKAGLRYEVVCSSSLPPVFIDHDMWEKIVLNLISNAFKYTLTGSVTVTLVEQAHKVILSVEDTGIGVPDAELPRLFERFHRVAGAHGRTFEGSGIGLALVQELVKLHGGDITATSTLGQGSCFRVRIPLGCAHLPAEHIAADGRLSDAAKAVEPFVQEALRWLPTSLPLPVPTPAPSDQAVSLGGRQACIFVVDDNADMREYVAKILLPLGKIFLFADGSAAITATYQQTPDLIVSDIMMPHTDGIELTQRLKADPRTNLVPILLLSARAGAESRIEGLKIGANDYLVKPFSAEELYTRAESLLHSGHLQTEATRLQERFYAMLMQAPVALCITEGPCHRVSLVNQVFRSLSTRLAAGEVIGKTISEIYPRASAENFIAILDEVYATGKTYTEHGRRLVLNDASLASDEVYIDFVCEAKRNIDGIIEGVFCVVNDVSRQYQARLLLERSEERLRQVVEELNAADRRKDEFLAALSHELRSPLNILTGHADLLRLEEPGSAEFEESLQAIERGVSVQTRLIGDLLDVSRIVTGKMQLNVDEFAIASMLRAAAEAIRFAARAKGVKFSMQLADDLGSMLGDATRLQQVFWNLLANAIKFTPTGGEVILSARRLGLTIEFEVIDNGAGITPEFLPSVFERFNQEDASRTKRHGGLGLGLAIVRHIAELHGGSVHAASAGKGLGSRFIVKVPTSRPPNPELSEA